MFFFYTNKKFVKKYIDISPFILHNSLRLVY